VRILREAHFYQTFAWKRDLTIRRGAFGSILADESQRAVAKTKLSHCWQERAWQTSGTVS
jgi:hypothetical protein